MELQYQSEKPAAAVEYSSGAALVQMVAASFQARQPIESPTM